MNAMTEQELMDAVQERQVLKEQIGKADKRIEEINQQLGGELALRGEKRVQVGEWQLQLVDGARKALDAQGLIKAGCPPAVLENPIAYKITPFVSLRVDKRV